jgi:hypothetical protein
VHHAFAEATQAGDDALANADYDAALGLLRSKGVVPIATGALGAKPEAYRRVVVIREDNALRILLQRVIPKL